MNKAVKTKDIYIVDTSALVENPDIIKTIAGIISVPDVAIKELEYLKTSANPQKTSKAVDALKNIKDNPDRNFKVATKISLDTLQKLAEALDVSVDNLLR